MGINWEPDLSVELAPHHPTGLRLANPVMIASGTFGWDGYGSGLPANLDLHHVGAIVAKTVTMDAREGNPEPRWHPHSWRKAWPTGESIYLNSVGLTNPGIHAALEEKAPVWATWEVPVILSIAGESISQFGTMASMAEGMPGVSAIELNLSCPNVDSGAQFSHSPQLALDTVHAVRESTSLPVVAKLSPNVPDITAIAKAVEQAGADAITICNTIPAMSIDVATRIPVLGAISGGLSGPALRPIAVALVYRAAQAVDIPIIGVGGIYSADNALEFILAGAWAVQLGSANLTNFTMPFKVVDDLHIFMKEQSISTLDKIRGKVWKH